MRELLIGVEGLALLRHLHDRPEGAGERRLAEVRWILDDPAFANGDVIREADPRTGYGFWSESYDEPGNPIIALEEPAVWSLVDGVAPGRALDAACGTGRHARRLVELGHAVVGVDITPEMLRRASAGVPEARFLEADLRDIPAPDDHFDLVVCALALAHLAELHTAVCELARVLTPGGRLVASALHPFQVHLGWHARFAGPRGERGFVREHPHTHADYLAAFGSAGLRVRGCLEPALTEGQVQSMERVWRHIPEAAAQAYTGLPAVLVWDVEKESRRAATPGTSTAR